MMSAIFERSAFWFSRYSRASVRSPARRSAAGDFFGQPLQRLVRVLQAELEILVDVLLGDHVHGARANFRIRGDEIDVTRRLPRTDDLHAAEEGVGLLVVVDRRAARGPAAPASARDGAATFVLMSL